jgi:hypothetical protein
MRNKLSLSLLATFLLLAGPLVKADTTYTYTGKPLNGENTLNGGYITGSVTLAAPLGDNFSGMVTPLAFDFTSNADPSLTLSSSMPGVYSDSSFFFITGAKGEIDGWIAEAFEPLGCCEANYVSTVDIPYIISDQWLILGAAGGYSYNTPGTWQVSSTPAPEPGSLPLFGTGIALLALGRKARKLLNAM